MAESPKIPDTDLKGWSENVLARLNGPEYGLSAFVRALADPSWVFVGESASRLVLVASRKAAGSRNAIAFFRPLGEPISNELDVIDLVHESGARISLSTTLDGFRDGVSGRWVFDEPQLFLQLSLLEGAPDA